MDWLARFLFVHTRQTIPDGRPLYAYKMNDAEYDKFFHEMILLDRQGRVSTTRLAPISDKIQNRLISKVRVVVEHVIGGIKRLHIVKAVFRNTKDGYEDQVIELACGLHNFRSDHRFSY